MFVSGVQSQSSHSMRLKCSENLKAQCWFFLENKPYFAVYLYSLIKSVEIGLSLPYTMMLTTLQRLVVILAEAISAVDAA